MSDKLEHGSEMKVERRVSRFNVADISRLITLPFEELQSMREKSAAEETAIFDKLCDDAGAWEAKAAETMLIDHAIEYAKAPSVKHTANKWINSEHRSGQEISNMVYKMFHHVYEVTKYDRDKKELVPVAWYLTWGVRTQSADGRYCGSVAGQDRKRFTEKAAMEKYLQGRIKVYSNLFTEISPPIPKEFASYFCVNAQLLPGYRVVGQPEKQDERPSAIGKLEAAKEAVAKNSAAKVAPDKSKGKSHGDALE